jgi:transcriptional regulator with PAS, ATPase and Fis domain
LVAFCAERQGGTVFLDEIGDISVKTQTDLLRVLQEREITRVGGNQPIKVDVRCVAGTNKDLEKPIEEGKFRPDLFCRLNVFRIELPPLRVIKEAVHELGHTLNLPHCDDYSCAMAPSHAVEWIDLKKSTLCCDCRAATAAATKLTTARFF